jgi:membrane protein YqaA with SNARE-associated domain
MLQKLSTIFQTKKFKQTTFVLGIIFIVLTFFISLDSKPFLKFGYPGVFLFNVLGVRTILFIPLVKHMNLFLLSMVTALGMGINDSVSWIVGRSGDSVIPPSEKVKKIESGLKKYGVFALFVWSLIPFPYDIIGFIAGYLEFSYKRFILPTFLGKLTRFLLLGTGILAVMGIK